MLFGLRVPRRRGVWLRLQAVADVPGPLEVELGDPGGSTVAAKRRGLVQSIRRHDLVDRPEA